MRMVAALLILCPALSGVAHAQAVIMPSNADLRAMQAPINWEGSRSQKTQEPDGVPTPVPSSPLLSALSSAVPFASLAIPAAPDTKAATGAEPTTRVDAKALDRKALDGKSIDGKPLDYTVDVLDKGGNVVETIARSSSLAVARAAFKEAAKERAGSAVSLRQGSITVAKRAAKA